MDCQKIHANEITQSESFLRIEFKKGGWTKANRNIIEGSIPVRKGSVKRWRISGKWNEAILAYNEETQEKIELWKPTPLE